jgi:putative membrane protein
LVIIISASLQAYLADSAAARAQGVPAPQPSGDMGHGPSRMDPGVPPGAGRDEMPVNRIDEKRFVKDALLNGMADIQLSKVALEIASSDSIKQLAQGIIDVDSKANEALGQLASKRKFDVPAALDSKHQSRIDKLSKLSGEEFDHAYTKEQLKEYQNQVKQFQMEAKTGSDPGVRQFASKMLAVLEERASTLKELEKAAKAAAK